MKSVTIIISHFESLPFLRTCVRRIRQYKHDLIDQIIYISDQSGNETHDKIVEEFGDDLDVKIIRTMPLWSGYGVDYILRYCDINTHYVCQMHVDVAVISKNWLYLCIKLIEEDNFTFVGQMQLVSLPTDTIYPPGKFFSMAAAFNMARTEVYKELSLNGGFTRFHNRSGTNMAWLSNDWLNWANEDYDHRGSDDDTPAFHWEDTHRQHSKLGLSITGMIQPHYGRVIEDIIFHFCSCRESIGSGGLGDEYAKLYQKVKEDYSEELIDEMLGMVKPTLNMRREVWDGVLKKNFPSSEELNKKIEELKRL